MGQELALVARPVHITRMEIPQRLMGSILVVVMMGIL
jgi:hypothetical protein